MIDQIAEALSNPQFMLAMFTAIAVFATVITLATPFLAKDQLKDRMKAVATERDKIRSRERARLAGTAGDKKGRGLKHETKPAMRQIVESLNLQKAFDDGSVPTSLAMAGYRGQAPVFVFLFARFIVPIFAFLVSMFMIFVLDAFPDYAINQRLLGAVAFCLIASYVPNMILKNKIQKRQEKIRKAWPDALDLILICLESGMSIEASFKKVAEEVGGESPPLAEEMSLTTAELSYLQHRRQAYDNLAKRTGMDQVKSVTLALIQSEKYGTPLANAMRVLAAENRDMRMAAAEQKAASLPPKLTVPMIIFFLPVLFMVLIGPAIIQLSGVDAPL